MTDLLVVRHESQTRQHGIGSYNKGCKCDECLAACRRKSRARCRRTYQSRERRPDDVMCVSCCCWFHEKGISRHEAVCDG